MTKEPQPPLTAEESELYQLYKFFVADTRRILDSTAVNASQLKVYSRAFRPVAAEEFRRNLDGMRNRPEEFKSYVKTLRDGAFSAISPQHMSDLEKDLDSTLGR